MNSEKKETVADIVAELRDGAADIAMNYSIVPIRREDQEADVAFLRRLADRIEAAWKREREGAATGGGNAAKLREALEAVVKVGYPHNFQREAYHIRSYCWEITAAIKKCFAALAAPARNCDRFATLDAARKAFYSGYFGPTEAEYIQQALLDWLFAPAEGGKESEAAR